MSASTSASMMICSTVSASARRKLPSSTFCIASINAILSSVIGSSSVAGEASQLHPSRQIRWPPQQRGAPAPDSPTVASALMATSNPPAISTILTDVIFDIYQDQYEALLALSLEE